MFKKLSDILGIDKETKFAYFFVLLVCLNSASFKHAEHTIALKQWSTTMSHFESFAVCEGACWRSVAEIVLCECAWNFHWNQMLKRRVHFVANESRELGIARCLEQSAQRTEGA
jgi:hypothetical protein